MRGKREYRDFVADMQQSIKDAHDYFGINLKIVWDIVKNELPMLKPAVKNIKGL